MKLARFLPLLAPLALVIAACATGSVGEAGGTSSGAGGSATTGSSASSSSGSVASSSSSSKASSSASSASSSSSSVASSSSSSSVASSASASSSSVASSSSGGPNGCVGCTASLFGSCASGVAVVGHYAGGPRTVCIEQGDGSTFELALMSYETTDWTLSGATGRVTKIQVYTYDPAGSITGNAGIPTAVQVGGAVPANPYNYAMSMGDCAAHTGYAGAVFGVPQASVCHEEQGLAGACGYPLYSCIGLDP